MSGGGSGGGVGPFGRTLSFPAITECDDGTMCDNSSPCVAHPVKESKYACDCSRAHLGAGGPLTGVSEVRFAGVYCEFRATSYCQKGKGGDYSDHAFCANGGECRVLVGRNEEHAGCKCPPNYEGHYCQFVRGGKPSDWELTDFMHPSLASSSSGSYGGGGGGGGMSPMGIFLITILSILACTLVASCCIFMDRDALRANAIKLKRRFSRNEKESDTANPDGGGPRSTSGMVMGMVLPGRRGSTGMASPGVAGASSVTSPQNAGFIGGKSVYKKRAVSGGAGSSTGPFVATVEALDADGGVLMEALDDVDQVPSMEEVDLDDDPNVMVNKGNFA